MFEDKFPEGKTIIVGRRAPSMVLIADNMVSGAHAEFTLQGDQLKVRDLGTPNGTFYNGQKIVEETLTLPCKLILGGTVVVEVTAAGDEDTTAVNFAAPPARPAQAPAPYAPPPVTAAPALNAPATVNLLAIIKNIFVGDGKIPVWEIIWLKLTAISSRRIVLTAIGASLVYFLLNWILLGASPLYGAIYATGLTFGVILVAVVFAGILALPGWLFRGSYNVRPMCIGFIATSLMLLLCKDILVPLSFASRLGFMWKGLALPMIFAAQFIGSFTWLMTTFTHRWARGLTRTAIIFAVLGTISQARKEIFIDRDKYLQTVFEMKESNMVPILGGPAISPTQLEAVFGTIEKELTKSYRAPRATASDSPD